MGQQDLHLIKEKVNLCCTVNCTHEQKRPPSEKSGWRYLRNKEKEPLVSKRTDFRGVFRCYKIEFLDFLPYLKNEKSYRRSAGVQTTGFLGFFQIFEFAIRFS